MASPLANDLWALYSRIERIAIIGVKIKWPQPLSFGPM